MKILIINGPNLNLLGQREPEIYGSASLKDINAEISKEARQYNFNPEYLQSNYEGEIIDWLQNAAAENFSGIIINPAAFTHTSVAIRDAFLAVALPFIEIHLTNIHAREAFRAHSYFSDIAQGVIAGLGAQGYALALKAAITALNKPSSTH